MCAWTSTCGNRSRKAVLELRARPLRGHLRAGGQGLTTIRPFQRSGTNRSQRPPSCVERSLQGAQPDQVDPPVFQATRLCLLFDREEARYRIPKTLVLQTSPDRSDRLLFPTNVRSALHHHARVDRRSRQGEVEPETRGSRSERRVRCSSSGQTQRGEARAGPGRLLLPSRRAEATGQSRGQGDDGKGPCGRDVPRRPARSSLARIAPAALWSRSTEVDRWLSTGVVRGELDVEDEHARRALA